MKLLVYTASGAVHEVDTAALTYCRYRVGRPRRGTALAELRRDAEQLRLLQQPPAPVVGQEWVLMLEPLAEEAVCTMRTTTPVVAVEVVDAEDEEEL